MIQLSNPSDENLHRFKFHVLTLTEDSITFLLSKANRSVPLFETTTPEYRTTTPRHYNDYYYRNNNDDHDIESTTPPQSSKSTDSNEFIEYKIGMKQKFDL